MKKITQFVFHKELSNDNIPKDINYWKNNLLSNYASVSHLGIQGEPGVEFYLNHGDDPITIGPSGIYELDLEGLGYITALKFDYSILIEKYNNEDINPYHRLIVDIVYEGADD
jgi:hypothetical protein